MVRHSTYVAIAALVLLAGLAATPVAAVGDDVDTAGEVGGGADVASVSDDVDTTGEVGGGADVASISDDVDTAGEVGGGADVASVAAPF